MDEDNWLERSESRTKKRISRNGILFSALALVVLTLLAVHFYPRWGKVDDADPRPRTATELLRQAVGKGDVEVVKWHITQGTPLNGLDHEDNGWNLPLTIAVMFGHHEIAELLLDAGALPDPPSFRTGRGIVHDSPLAQSLLERQKESVRLLLDYGADPNAKVEGYTTPLNLAAYNGEPFVQLLVDAGAEVNTSDSNGLTPLHVASARGRTDVTPYLLANGADPIARDKDGMTPLHLSGAKTKVAELLLKAGADPNIRADMENGKVVMQIQNRQVHLGPFSFPSAIALEERKDWTPLHCGAAIGNEAYVKLLLEHGARVNIKDAKGRTPLDIARLEGRDEIVTLLETWINEHPQAEEGDPEDAE